MKRPGVLILLGIIVIFVFWGCSGYKFASAAIRHVEYMSVGKGCVPA